MLNVNELENRWRKYKIKSYTPYLVISVSLIIIVILLSTLYKSKENSYSKETQTPIKAEPLKEENTHIKIEPVKVEPIKKEVIKENVSKVKNKAVEVIKKEIPLQEQANNSANAVILSPSLNFMANLKHSTISNDRSYNEITTSSKIKHTEKRELKIEKKADIISQQNTPAEIDKIEQKIEKKDSIKIKRQNTQDDISHVLQRFEKNNNPALSLFVAKKYYELGQYGKSYNYALITNEINSNIEISWIIFAKSLVKLDKKKEAVKILKSYISSSHSNQAKILLEDIISGKFI